jgi:hypothetical protein
VRYLDLARAVRERSEESEIRGVQFQPKGGPGIAPSTCEGLNSLISLLSQLEARCPELVDPGSWQQAIEDGRRFLARWGEQAEGLGWSSRDLFGLAPVPDNPAANYRRLSRYDETGLIWLLRGRPMVALTADTAAIENPTGAVSIYRKNNKPALGPLGDSLDDFR